VPDELCVVRAGLHKESPEVVCRQPHLTLVAVCGNHDVPYARAAYLPVPTIVVVGRGPLRMLLAPLLATLGAIFGTLDGNVRQCLLAAAWGRLSGSLGGTKCSCLVASGIQVGNAVRLLGGVPKNVVVFVLAWVSHTVLKSCARAPLASWELVGEPRVRRTGTATTVGLGMRNQLLVLVVPSVPQKMLRRASAIWSWPIYFTS
jgi:hypothetical protein